MTTTLENLKQKMAETKKLIADSATSAFKEAFKDFFERHPECLAVRWRQYTPYFSDGDPCRFSVHDYYVRLPTTDEEDGDYSDGFAYPGHKSPLDTDLKAIFDVDDELFEAAFGDHVRVTATREGFEVDEYSHD